ncbi:hypothetical protein SPRG_13801 [Saprolegnia parasitica CBS 223.65]|uniref:Dynein regulatory complex protein 9 n=1 Tax=Saprolegnia parasitica (strain CBS 223.65) TaxID=695850 RepID=A0A067C2S1_SAPPC|nr:hypothetical protein SPRG_13801 [Saprolegnia parasitica CBS 223.65]KDO21092.1 hypothetical protein SPRG_13801 [Saprolegnia parasitica CBS 223.65]|eukprot:XP_012208187.1 hypothetical protein SPRG_13801 [Saprolegnia parasitica CBS 223.65]
MKAAHRLSPVEATRACAILEETIEKLSFLGSITPDILQHREELSQVVGDEISRIIQEQRRLEAKYESLISQRSVLKGLANKSKFKETQRDIQEVSRALRESTRSLCRNLKDNPNFGGNLMKIQYERQALIDLLTETTRELRGCGYESLVTYVTEGKHAAEKAADLIETEKKATEEVKRLTQELAREKVEHTREIADQKSAIALLKEQLLQVKSKTQIDIRYARSEAKAKTASTARLYQQLITEEKAKIEAVTRECDSEARVHVETVGFLKAKHESLHKDFTHWNEKYERDMAAKQAELAKLTSERNANAAKLEGLQKRWVEEVELQKNKENEKRRLKELEVLKREEAKKQTFASRKIQAAYRAHKILLDEKKKLAETSKKKKKGGKKGKK